MIPFNYMAPRDDEEEGNEMQMASMGNAFAPAMAASGNPLAAMFLGGGGMGNPMLTALLMGHSANGGMGIGGAPIGLESLNRAPTPPGGGYVPQSNGYTPASNVPVASPDGWDWNAYLTGGAATRNDSISGLKPEFQNALLAMFQGAPPEIRDNLRVMSGYRSPEVQATLWENALAKYGSEAAARKWVAPPGRSNHNHGQAVDLTFMDDATKAWVHQNAANYGMSFPMSWEPWHIELAGARG